MLKRILAWIILGGFVLLLLNIAIFHFYLQASIAVYVVIVIFFVLSSGKIVPMGTEVRHDQDTGSGNDNDVPDTAGGDMDKAEDGKKTDKGKD